MDLEEFKALVKNLVPATLEQAERICNEVERLTQEHPELKEKLEEWCKMPESEEKELRELINSILTEAEQAERERKAWLSEKLKEARMKRQYINAHQKRTKHDHFNGAEGLRSNGRSCFCKKAVFSSPFSSRRRA